MAAIYKRELRYFFHTFVGWLYLAVMLFMTGIYFTVCNMLSGYPTISYVLQSVVFLIVFAIPLLTMRSLSEERKYRTDQLILTAPVSVGRIVLGKYLALVTVFAIPLILLGLTPLVLMQAGQFQTGLSYTSLLGYFLYGCLGLAIGLFLSSLTESVVIAAVLGLIAMFVCYIMGGLCNILSNMGTTAVTDIVVRVLQCFDMVSRFDVLSSGYFEVEAVVYFVTFTAFVLFCTVQAIQKRRYAVAGRGIKLGAYSIFNILVAAAVVIAVNLGLNYVPDRYTSYDVTVNDLFTLTDDTVQIVEGLSDDVTIYVLVDETAKDNDLDRILEQFRSRSSHIHVEYIDPVANPMFYYKYTETPPMNNSLIVSGKNGDVVVDYQDLYVYEMNYYTYQSELVANDAEGQILSAVMRTSLDDIPKFYGILGHNELELDETFKNALLKENAAYEEIQLQTVDAVPADAAGIFLNAPLSDYSADDVEKVRDYLSGERESALRALRLVDVGFMYQNSRRQVVVYDFTDLGKGDKTVVGERTDALCVAVAVPPDHHRAADELFTGVFLIGVERIAVLYFAVDIYEDFAFGHTEVSVDLFCLAVEIKGQREEIFRKVVPFRSA